MTPLFRALTAILVILTALWLPLLAYQYLGVKAAVAIWTVEMLLLVVVISVTHRG